MNAILQILPNFHTGGVEQTALIVSEAIAKEGLSSFIASAHGGMVEALSKNVTHIDLPLNTKNPLKILANIWHLKKIIEKNTIKIVHARSRAPAWSAYFAAKLTGVHFITSYHGAYSQNSVKWFYNRVMSLGNPVAVPSKFMERHVMQYYPKARCVEVPSGIDTGYFCPSLVNQSQISELRSFWESGPSKKIILLVGRFTRIKGHQFLLDAANLSANKQNLKIVFLGDGQNTQLVEELQKNARGLSLDLAVHLDEPDLRPFFAAADIVVVPTTKPEAFGRVTAEAMSMSKIVIGNDLGASSEVINNPDWIFSHNSPNSLAEKIDRALNLDEEQILKIGENNRIRAHKNYGIKNLTNGYLGIYRKILREK